MMIHRICGVFLVLLSVSLQAAVGFYVPGVAPMDFEQGARVDVKVFYSQSCCPYLHVQTTVIS